MGPKKHQRKTQQKLLGKKEKLQQFPNILQNTGVFAKNKINYNPIDGRKNKQTSK